MRDIPAQRSINVSTSKPRARNGQDQSAAKDQKKRQQAPKWGKAGCADWTDMLIYNGEIAGPELRVLRALCRHANEQTGALFIGKATIARFARMDPGQVVRVRNSLIAKKLIMISEAGKSGAGNANNYQLLTDWNAVQNWLELVRAEREYWARQRRARDEKGDAGSPISIRKSPKKSSIKGDSKGDPKGDVGSPELVRTGNELVKDSLLLRSKRSASLRSAGASAPRLAMHAHMQNDRLEDEREREREERIEREAARIARSEEWIANWRRGMTTMGSSW
jgi:hypothetical protein